MSSNGRKLFGTDGIRGTAHQFPLDVATMFALGEALSHRLKNGGAARPRVLLGMDTRESGPEIASALIAGIGEGGGEALYIGVVPTPAVAFLCRTTDAAAGISISASHNPYQDNGVKIFGHNGMKLPDALEGAIEEELMALRRDDCAVSLREFSESAELIRRYGDFLLESVGEGALKGMKVVLDTGHGASCAIARDVFERAGAEVVIINAQPTGTNINDGSGALHPEGVAKRVVEEKANLGIAFDGDADRAIFADDAGAIRNGDEILYLWGVREKRQNTLANDTIVATVMSNLGFEKQLEREGIRLLRAAVGDKYVLEMMIEHGAVLGGEQSGHIIDLHVHTTGDGLHTGLAVTALLAQAGRPFSRLETFTPMPQILVNEKVRSKPPLESLPRYQEVARECEESLGSRGRILVRYSGTENLVRVMVEGESDDEIRSTAGRLVGVLRDEIG
jgi:phosphoglucosamine mutase